MNFMMRFAVFWILYDLLLVMIEPSRWALLGVLNVILWSILLVKEVRSVLRLRERHAPR
jgi:hypothetical protein